MTREAATAIFCAAPHGVAAALIDALLATAEAAARQPHVVDISADFRYSSAPAYEKVYRHAHGAPGRIAPFTCARAGASARAEDVACRAPGLLRDRGAARHRAAAGVGPDHAATVRLGVTGSTGSGRKPSDEHAPSAAPQRPLQLQRAVAPTHAGDHCLRARRQRRRGAIRLRAALRAVRARHTCHGAGAAALIHGHREGAWPPCASSTPARHSYASATARRASRRSLAATTRNCRPSVTAARWRYCALSTTSTRARPAAPCNG